jgi:hypothetical protein
MWPSVGKSVEMEGVDAAANTVIPVATLMGSTIALFQAAASAFVESKVKAVGILFDSNDSNL